MADIGWRFPPTHGGKIDGFNDSGMVHFIDDPLVSLARETIQNSLDAKSDAEGPVHMEFSIERIDRHESLGQEELAAAIEACLREVDGLKNEDKAHKTLEEAQALLRRPTLPYLRIADQNTTGLNARHWKALVKEQGTSVKENPGAGGSYGIGKYAPFVVSPLRTVFYWTRCGGAERFQGKAVLMSHQAAADTGETQGTGFFGYVDDCRELTATVVPGRIRRIEHGRNRGNGTSLWIAGFRTTGEWQPQIARSVVSNFFYAIERGALCVIIEPNRDMTNRGLIEIKKSNIKEWFDYLLETDESRDDNDDDVTEARLFWDLIRSSEPSEVKQDRDLGFCQLWIRVADGLPGKVGLIRKNGMLITAQQRGLQRFQGLKDFIAVCVFEAEEGNELLRKMENPKHNQFKPNLLSGDSEQKKGRAALKRITIWIRNQIKKHAGLPPADKVTNLGELWKYLPDLEAEEPMDHLPGTDEQPFDKEMAKVVVRSKRRTLDDNSNTSDGGSGKKRPGSGGGNSGGSGKGNGDGESGREQGRQTVPISDVRFVPILESTNRYRVSFKAGDSGAVKLDFGEAGDSTAIKRTDVKAFNKKGRPLDLEHIELEANRRMEFEITATDAIGGRAWRVLAVRRSS